MKRIGIDLGGTFIKAGITDENNDIIFKGEAPTGLPCPPETVADNIAGLIKNLVADAGLTIDDIESIGMGSPGTVDSDRGVVEYANNLGFRDVHFSDMLRERIGRPIYIGNDANVAAYGEYIKCGEKYDSFVFVTLGTGVGSGIIIDGKIYTGFNFAGAELGHVVIQKDGYPCTCGRKGCWESYSSTNALIRMCRDEMRKDKSSALRRLCEGDESRLTGKIVFAAVAEGDNAAKAALKTFIDYLACGIANVINIFQPEALCIGGGISAERDLLIEPLKKAVEAETYGNCARRTEIRAAKLLNNAGIVGAAALGGIYK
ncbi:MAG: ROK family protein [Clostridia bacterium]|nr:ROK family protein [Clostridia bacterium]